jgi:hypothetical protein
VETQVVVGDSVTATLHDLVAREHVDLVVLSAHGYTCAVDRPYGGVGTALIAYGTTPLLIVQDLARLEPGGREDEAAGSARLSYTTAGEAAG